MLARGKTRGIVRGEASPLFHLFDYDRFPSSVADLNPAMTINGTTKYPTFRYTGPGANGVSWNPWGYGESCALQAGAAPTYNNGSPLLGPRSINGSVLFNSGGYYRCASNTFADITTDDIILEIVVEAATFGAGTKHILGKWNGTGYVIYITSTGVVACYLQDAVTNRAVSTAALTNNVIYHIIWFMDRSGSGLAYVNGIAQTPGSIVGVPNTLTCVQGLALGQGLGTTYSKRLFYCSMWQGIDWLNSELQPTIARERFAKLIGVYPQQARGTAYPTTLDRSTTAYIKKLEEDGTTKMYQVGPNWLPSCSRIGDDGATLKGYSPTGTAMNVCLQSEDFTTTWTKLDAGDTITPSAIEAPNRKLAASALIADATDGVHGVAQVITLTATKYSLGVFTKKGDEDWFYLANSTIANCYSYFDLSTGSLGTKGAGAFSAKIRSLGDGYYFCEITYTGTAAAHTHQIQTAHADNDNDFAGDGVTPNTYIWGAIADDGNISQGAGQISCNLLLDATNYKTRSIVSIALSGNELIATYIYWDGRLRSYVRVGGVDSALIDDSVTQLEDNNKHHVVMRYDTNEVEQKVDSAVTGTPVAPSAGIPTSLAYILPGRYIGATSGFAGILNNLKIFGGPRRD